MPLFSIVIPVYNTHKYLQSCVDSLKSQDFKDFEAILVDDGSIDDSGKLCDEIASNDERFRVIHQKNCGVSAARNKGIELAKGEYLLFVDSDDTVKYNLLSVLNQNIKEQKADIYFYNTNSFADVSNVDFKEFLHKYYFTYKVGFGPCNKVYNASIIRQYSLRFDTQETIGEDLLFNVCYYKTLFKDKKKKCAFIGDELYNYIDREGSAMNSGYELRLAQQMRLFDKILLGLKGIVDKSELQYFFILHLVSGVNQSKKGAFDSNSLLKAVDFNKYKEWLNIDKLVKTEFFKNENATALGKVKFNLIFSLLKIGAYSLAAKLFVAL